MVIVLPISLALVTPSYGLDLIPTFIAMVLLAIPPILVNAYAGLREVDRDLVEAARGMGLRERQILRGVEVPLALAGDHRRVPDGGPAGHRDGDDRGRRRLGGLGRFIIDGRARASPGPASCWAGVAARRGARGRRRPRARRSSSGGSPAARNPDQPRGGGLSDLPEFPLLPEPNAPERPGPATDPCATRHAY